MSHPEFDRTKLSLSDLADRSNRCLIERDKVMPTDEPRDLPGQAEETVAETVERVKHARDAGRSVMLAFGAHAIKNGMGPVLIDLIEKGWVTHLATNGAGIIHDWEFAFSGGTSEEVEKNMSAGRFGLWKETGYFINLALAVGAYRGLGYGESVGELILDDGLYIPSADELKTEVSSRVTSDPSRAAAAADLLEVIAACDIPAGRLQVAHPFKQYSVQAAACRLGVPFTGHPMIGQDVIYTHPANHGGVVGRTGLRDFLRFAESVNRIDGGVYMSVGSAVMSPMVFEKSIAMCFNRRLSGGKTVRDHYIVVVDLAEASPEWNGSSEPSESDSAYYLRFHKTFRRVGGTARYISASGRDFLLAVCHGLSP